MFCNPKYTGFPLFKFSAILACDCENELIAVTARQCILIIVSLINERPDKKIYDIHLSEIPMIVFFARIGSEFQKVGVDHEGICRYIADLMF